MHHRGAGLQEHMHFQQSLLCLCIMLLLFCITNHLLYSGIRLIDLMAYMPDLKHALPAYQRHEIRRNDLIGRYGFRCRSRQSRNTFMPLAFGCKESGMSTGFICILLAPICSKHHVAFRHLQHA